MTLLNRDQYLKTLSEPMTELASDAEPPFDFWDYFEAIPPEDFGGFDCSEGLVNIVYVSGDARYQHVLVNATMPNVFMVLVLDVAARQVAGHHLLNLIQAYGLDED